MKDTNQPNSRKHVVAHLDLYAQTEANREAANIASRRYHELLLKFPEFAKFQTTVSDPLLGSKELSVVDYVNYYFIKLTGTDPRGIITEEDYRAAKAHRDVQAIETERLLADKVTQKAAFENQFGGTMDSEKGYIKFDGNSNRLWKLAERLTATGDYLGSIPSLSQHTGLGIAPRFSSYGIDSTALSFTLNCMCSTMPIYARCARALGAEVYTADSVPAEKFEYSDEKTAQSLREGESVWVGQPSRA